MEIIAPINVIISWEGYEIQGHTALCVALEYISYLKTKLENPICNKSDVSKKMKKTI